MQTNVEPDQQNIEVVTCCESETERNNNNNTKLFCLSHTIMQGDIRKKEEIVAGGCPSHACGWKLLPC